jgi:3D (Asp-Asp-Asp) domain-containing protein
MKRLLIILVPFVMAAGYSASAHDQTILARITVYWPGGSGSDTASYNGAKLRLGHCAVDPKKIAYGSKVIFPDADCLAVDSGPAVVSRTAARRSGKTQEQRDALVIDRYFESKRQALAWAAANPHFMMVRVLAPLRKIAQAIERDVTGKSGAESAETKATNTCSQTANLAPADIRGSLFPMCVGGTLPRS